MKTIGNTYEHLQDDPVGYDPFEGLAEDEDEKTGTSADPFDTPRNRKFLVEYFATGDLGQAGRLANLTRQDIAKVRASTWFKQEFQILRVEKGRQFANRLDGILEKSVFALEDRLLKGDAFFDKEGELSYKPMNGRDVATVMGKVAELRRAMANPLDPMAYNNPEPDALPLAHPAHPANPARLSNPQELQALRMQQAQASLARLADLLGGSYANTSDAPLTDVHTVEQDILVSQQGEDQ